MSIRIDSNSYELLSGGEEYCVADFHEDAFGYEYGKREFPPLSQLVEAEVHYKNLSGYY